MNQKALARWIKVGLLFCGIALLVASLATLQSDSHTSHAHEGIVDKAYAAPATELPADLSSVAHLAALDTHQVHIHERHFFVPNREQSLTAFPCSNCHTDDVGALKTALGTEEKLAHWDQELHHANATIMNCETCHDTKTNELVSLTGERIGFNNSYLLCGQCHQGEQKDWAGGAHGKRIGGWANPVVRETCVNCHNPHNPGFESKMPERLNTYMIEQREPK